MHDPARILCPAHYANVYPSACPLPPARHLRVLCCALHQFGPELVALSLERIEHALLQFHFFRLRSLLGVHPRQVRPPLLLLLGGLLVRVRVRSLF